MTPPTGVTRSASKHGSGHAAGRRQHDRRADGLRRPAAGRCATLPLDAERVADRDDLAVPDRHVGERELAGRVGRRQAQAAADARVRHRLSERRRAHCRAPCRVRRRAGCWRRSAPSAGGSTRASPCCSDVWSKVCSRIVPAVTPFHPVRAGDAVAVHDGNRRIRPDIGHKMPGWLPDWYHAMTGTFLTGVTPSDASVVPVIVPVFSVTCASTRRSAARIPRTSSRLPREWPG